MAAAGIFAKAIEFFIRKDLAKEGADAALKGAAKRSLRSRLFGAGRKDIARSARVMTRDPIDVASGEVVLHRRDAALPGVLPLMLERTHISSYREGRLFGPSWASTLDQHLEVDADGVCYAAADGMVLDYPNPPVGATVFPLSGPRWPLTYDAGGRYTVEDPRSLQRMHFGTRGWKRRLQAISDRSGNRIDLAYDESGSLTEIRHTGGYRIAAETADGRITSLRLVADDDAQSQVLARYAYDDAGNLTQAFDPSGEDQRFTYDHQGRLTGWRDRSGHWYRYAYDEQGRGIRGEGDQGVLDTGLRYDPAGRWTEVTDSLGNTTTYRLGDRRRVISQVDPLGNETTFEWDEQDRLLSRTDPLGATVRYFYDDAGNLTGLRRPDGRESHASYDALGLPVHIVEADGTAWRNQHDERGNLTAVIDPLGNLTRYEHDEHGAVTSVVDPLGNTTTIQVNAAGLPLEVTDPTGSATRYAYDALGRVSTITDPIGGTAVFTWTPEGLPASRRLPGGATERWEYDPEGNLAAYTDGAGRTSRTEYGAFATPLAHIGPDGTRLTFGHDTELRLTTVVDQQGLSWRYEYDPAGNLIGETDFDHRPLTYRHDAAGRLISRTDGDERPTEYVRDSLGNVVEKRTTDQITGYEYDLAGRLVRAVNPAADLRFDRDPLGRITAEICDGRTVTSAYDASGRRISRRTPTGAVSSWDYDPAGRPTALVTAGRRFAFEYDAAGREVRRRVGAETVLDQRWNADHQLVSQEVWRGPRPDAAATLVQHRNYVYGPGREITATWDQIAGSRRFTLDRNGRVTAVQAQGWTERYAYNEAGDIVHAGWPAGGESTDEAQTVGEREYRGTRLYRAGRTFYRYDDRGRTILRHHRTLSGRQRSWRYEWDAEDRLVASVTPDGHQWRYRYDALGRRVTKQRVGPDGTVAEQVDFTWDGECLVEETHRRPAGDIRVTSWDYRPGTFEPIAQYRRGVPADASQEWFDRRFHAIITDAIGSPAELVDTNGDIAWRRGATLFGGRLGGRAATETVDCPIGFPGQYHDAETGLAYNRHRYYAAETGRYLSSDPIGLAGGVRTYGYVRNPMVHIDPLGLSQELPPGMIRIFRTTDRAGENEIYQRTGYIMSDAAQKGYQEGGTLEHALARSQHVHDHNVNALGQEGYAWAHQGGATWTMPAGDRSLISFSTDEVGARRWAERTGNSLYAAVVHPSEVNWTTHGGSETEVLASHMIRVMPWK
jgi:RHS repeat-associated protein